MRLAAFIRANMNPIATEWEDFAKTLSPAADDMSPLALRDHIREILAFIADDIESHQTDAQQVEKSRGEKPQNAKRSAAEVHASLRHAGGFNMDQMVSEYRALRASVVNLWDAQLSASTRTDIRDLTRFHESIDQALTESISDYSKKIEHSRNLFLGILSHDLRTPISVARMSAELVLRMGEAAMNERQSMLISQVLSSADRATEMIDQLLDLTRVRLGSGVPIIKAPMNLGYVAKQLVDEMRTKHPERIFTLEIAGNTDGEWDKPRIGQVFSNLLGNAVQYSFKESPIAVVVKEEAIDVVLSLHNEGVPIPPDAIGRIFESLVRVEAETYSEEQSDVQTSPVNLGLGLYITKEIVAAHGGTIGVTSSEQAGTLFSVHFPRTQKEPA